ncbi:AAA family ATPase, partial [Campylobacter lari]|nr:AAA family ATPase [Campylobacter lari]
MITKISMKNVASYKDETTLETNKRINLIYGLNGTGKTQISKFLANQEDENFKDCKIEGLNNEQQILVYNQDFIEKNFYDTDKQQGIFTLSEENTSIKQEIENLQKELIELKSNQDENERKLKEELSNLKIRNNEAIKNLWEHIGKKYAKKFKNFFENIKTKNQLHDALLHRYEGKRENILYHNEKETYTGSSEGVARMCSVEDRELIRLFYINEDKYLKDMEEIEKQYNILMDMQAEKTENIAQLSINKEGFLAIENNNLFREKIIGNQNSLFAKLINKLDNQSWVKNGFDKYIQNSEICPFCQTKGVITHEFKDQLMGYFNKDYEGKIKSLMELKNRYEILLDNIPKIDKYYRNQILDEYDFKFEKLYNDVISVLFNNLKIIDEKIKVPDKILKFSDSKSAIEQFNNYIIEKQQEIIKYNELIDNKNQKLPRLKEDFWDLIMRMNIEEICDCREMFENIKEVEFSITNKERKRKEREREIEREIIKNQENIINIQKAVDKINNHLKDLGILSFYIKAQNDEKQEYIIVREGEDKPSFKTLSEGEKTLISFLYFLQLCQGKKEKNEVILD